MSVASERSMRSPSNVIVPLVILPRWTSRRPEIARRQVVFPAPFEPSSATIAPGRHGERYASKAHHHVAVDDLDVRECEHHTIRGEVAEPPPTASERTR